MTPPKPLLIAISGPSSSGKTTLSRLFRDIFNACSPKAHAFILHQDDVYKTDADIPVNDEGLQDWDCLESINLPLLKDTLAFVAQHGKLPEEFESQEDRNAVGKVNVHVDTISHCVEAIRSTLEECTAITEDQGLSIAIIDGFLLFAETMTDIRSLFDVKLFLRTDYKTAKTRREARQGYVTIEGFWEDPPGYVDKVVWPNYVKDHAFLFQDGDVEGQLDDEVCQRVGIKGMPRNAEGDMAQTILWANAEICTAIKAIYRIN